MWTLDYFFQHIFSGVATILSVGGVVLGYKLQQQGERVKAARVLLAEIRNAEKIITEIKNSQTVSDFLFLLPNNSWQNLRHLFVQDLSEDEVQLISDFYVACILADSAISRMKSYPLVASNEKIKITQQKFLELAEKYKNNKDNFIQGSSYDLEKRAILNDLFYKENDFFLPSIDAQKLQQYLQNVRYITTSTAGEKLRKKTKIKLKIFF